MQQISIGLQESQLLCLFVALDELLAHPSTSPTICE